MHFECVAYGFDVQAGGSVGVYPEVRDDEEHFYELKLEYCGCIYLEVH